MAEFYLASFWRFHEKGVARLMETLESLESVSSGWIKPLERHFERFLILRKVNAEFTFEPTLGWFKVTCGLDDIETIQKAFKNEQASMEAEVEVGDVVDEDGNIKVSRAPRVSYG